MVYWDPLHWVSLSFGSWSGSEPGSAESGSAGRTACWSGARTAWHGQVGDRDIGEGGGHQTGESSARPIPQYSVDIAGFKRSKSLPKWRLVAGPDEVSGLWATGQRRVWRHSPVRKSFFFSVDERL